MADFEVKVRNLKTGETLIASMADAQQCCDWLAERPRFMEIITVLSDISPADSHRLKDAMRPYDEEELALKREYDEKAQAVLNERYQAELAQIESAKSEPEDPNADPDRPLSVKYEVDDGFEVVDDSRELTDVAREACVAWVAERNSWVKAKGQIVGEAHLEVYPGPVPGGDESDRVLAGGRFFVRLAEGSE